MYLIGLTGNIASGKSTVARMLEQLGARVIDADVVAHQVLARGTPTWRRVIDAFGTEILQSDGTIDRRKLASIVFSDPSRLERLEQITHPAVGAELALLVRDAKEPVVVIEAVKLYEAGMHEFMDALWVVTAPPEEQKRRLIEERDMSEDEANARLQSRPPLHDKLERADVVIDNSGSIEQTRAQVMQAFAALDPSRGGDPTALVERWLERAQRAQA